MIEKTTTDKLSMMLKRIFTLPQTRTTFREIQSAFMGIANGDKELFTDLLESVLAGQIKPILKDQVDIDAFTQIISQYCIPTRVSKEIHDKGQFISFITSDVLSQPNGVVFSNCIKTVEGQEHRFFTDIESTIQLINHFVGRIHEAGGLEASKEQMDQLSNEIEKLKANINSISVSK
ncbi:MAG: CT_584 family protein [Chlamydiota bacterium]|nr:CT_584 family protein [Chlamydiota bacterium]